MQLSHAVLTTLVASMLFGGFVRVDAQAGSPAAERTAEPAAVPAAAQTEKPLPDIGSLIARAKANQAKVEALRKNYICKMTSVADEFSSNGSKKTHTDEYQVYFVEGHEIHQHLTHDGKPLSADEAKKDQERIDKQVADIKAHKGNQRGNINLSPSHLLKVVTFSGPTRVMMNGRPTIRFDYNGNPKAKTSDMGEEVLSKLNGTVWIDEQDAAVARIVGTLGENFHVAGGLLVNLKKGSHFELTQTPINGEIWMMRHFDGHVDGRFLLFKGFDGEARIEYSDYRKMKSTVTINGVNSVLDENGNPLPQPSETEPVRPPQ